MKNLNSIRLKYIILFLFVLANSIQAQQQQTVAFNVVINSIFNPYMEDNKGKIIVELDPDGNEHQVKTFLGKDYNKIINIIVTKIKNGLKVHKGFFYRMKDDLLIAVSIQDSNNTPDNKKDDECEVLVVSKLGFLVDYDPVFSNSRTAETARYPYKTFFYIGTSMQSAKYTMKEYIPAGRWGNYLTENEYNYDFIAKNSLKGRLLTLDPNFKGVISDLRIEGN